jgi:hypothetical protein
MHGSVPPTVPVLVDNKVKKCQSCSIDHISMGLVTRRPLTPLQSQLRPHTQILRPNPELSSTRTKSIITAASLPPLRLRQCPLDLHLPFSTPGSQSTHLVSSIHISHRIVAIRFREPTHSQCFRIDAILDHRNTNRHGGAI